MAEREYAKNALFQQIIGGSGAEFAANETEAALRALASGISISPAGIITLTQPPVFSAASLTNIPTSTSIGGLPLSTLVAGDLLVATGASALARLADVAAGSVLASGGVGVAPAWASAPTFSAANLTNLATVQSSTSTGTQHNFAQTAARHLVLRLNNASLLTITGFIAGMDGDIIDVVSIGAGQVDFPHAQGSSAANQLTNCATSAATSLAAGSGTGRYVYDGTTARWRLVAHEQGAWITPAYAAGDFTASGAMTWTVDAGDVRLYRYWLKGRTEIVAWALELTSVGGTPGGQLKFKIPGGFTSASLEFTNAMMYRDNGGAYTASVAYAATAGTTISLYTAGFAQNWTASTNLTGSYGEMAIEVT